MNLLYNNNAVYKNGQKEASEAGLVYMVNPVWEGKRILETKMPPPVKHTFYAGCNLSADVTNNPSH